MSQSLRLLTLTLCLFTSVALATAQETSVKPGINDSFRDPNPSEFTERFEVESREVFALRNEIVAACEIQPGQTVADIGAGTGLFTRLFADAVGEQGRVIAVDIAPNFLAHIERTARAAGQRNVETRLATADSTQLSPNSVDVAFICDTYHHFEFPYKTMASLHRAMKPGGRVILIDFHRIEGVTREWTLNHVRAGQEVFEAEISDAGFRKRSEHSELLEENYFVVFEKNGSNDEKTGDRELVFPIVSDHGGIVSRPQAVDQPVSGAKVIFDATAGSDPEAINKALDRIARLLNLYGAAGLSASDVTIAVVMHGEATASVLHDQAYATRFGAKSNPNLPLITELQRHGVKVLVCGQALNYKGFADNEVAADIPISASALTTIINRQADGHAYVPVP